MPSGRQSKGHAGEQRNTQAYDDKHLDNGWTNTKRIYLDFRAHQLRGYIAPRQPRNKVSWLKYEERRAGGATRPSRLRSGSGLRTVPPCANPSPTQPTSYLLPATTDNSRPWPHPMGAEERSNCAACRDNMDGWLDCASLQKD